MTAKQSNMNPVVHFELPAEDKKRMAEFYTNVFGWRTQMLGPEMGNYVIATTTEPDETGRPKNPGAINGGFFTRSDDKPAQYPSVVIAVENIKEHIKKVASAGGQGAWRTDGYTRRRIVRRFFRYRGQQAQHARVAYAYEVITLRSPPVAGCIRASLAR